jgi:serine/threonine-protein kinase RsbW
MTDIDSGQTQHADLALDSSLQSVDRAEDVVLQAAREMGFHDDDQHRIGIAVRECMVNAVAHGNRYSAKKKVRLRVSWNKSAIEIDIEDEGDGFDMGNVPDPRDEANLMRHSGRGLLMIRAFMDRLEFRKREPRGTGVRMIKILRPAPPGNS